MCHVAMYRGHAALGFSISIFRVWSSTTLRPTASAASPALSGPQPLISPSVRLAPPQATAVLRLSAVLPVRLEVRSRDRRAVLEHGVLAQLHRPDGQVLVGGDGRRDPGPRLTLLVEHERRAEDVRGEQPVASTVAPGGHRVPHLPRRRHHLRVVEDRELIAPVPDRDDPIGSGRGRRGRRLGGCPRRKRSVRRPGGLGRLRLSGRPRWRRRVHWSRRCFRRRRVRRLVAGAAGGGNDDDCRCQERSQGQSPRHARRPFSPRQCAPVRHSHRRRLGILVNT